MRLASRGAAAVLAFGGLLPCADVRAQDAAVHHHALVIGLNKSSANVEGVIQLAHAQNDATEIARVLKEQGFEDTVPLVGSLARRETIVDELTRLAREAKPQDIVLIYFAGHGVRAKWAEQGSKLHSYWLAYDTTLARLEIDGLRLEHVMDYVDDIPAARKVVILDHCHSGTVDLPRTTGGGGGRDGTGTLKIKRDLFLPRDFNDQVVARVGEEGLLILGSATDTAYELSNLHHGLFTYVLLQALTTKAADTPPAGNGDGMLSADELVKYLTAKVAPLARDNSVSQSPIYLTRGNVLGWDILALPQDPGVDKQALLQILGSLAAIGLSAPNEQKCNLAINAWTTARTNRVAPTDRDQRIVARLQAIQALGPGVDWTSEAQKMTGFLNALDQ